MLLVEFRREGTRHPLLRLLYTTFCRVFGCNPEHLSDGGYRCFRCDRWFDEVGRVGGKE